VAGALAAGLTAMAARYSGPQLREAGDLAARADELRHRVTDLADADARAYQAVLAAYRLPEDGGQRQRQVREALLGAALVPLEMAETGAQVAGLAAGLACSGNPRLRGDAITGALLAAASARSAAALVDINVGLGGLDAELSRRAAWAAAARDAAEAAVTAGGVAGG
jgi:formiminotetrahydrofolate cyclodeaminase